jgi:hypothetical protein
MNFGIDQLHPKMMISFGVQAMKTMINLVSVIAAKLEKMHRPFQTQLKQ